MPSKPPPPLPTRDGVSASFVWVPEGYWENALEFLCDYFPEVSLETWTERMQKREVCDSNGHFLSPISQIKRGMCLFYYREIPNEIKIPFCEHILFQDEHLLVVDKPHFLPVTPGGGYLRETLLVRLKRRTQIDHLTPLHRLDRETAGIMLFSKQVQSRGAYQVLFQHQQIDKTYHALAPHLDHVSFPLQKKSRLVEGPQFFVMQEVPGEANSETQIHLLERRGAFSMYELRPRTGKKHQLRVHLASLGAPIINDTFYPIALPHGSDDFEKPLKLLAKSIAFTDPITGESRHFESQLTL
ncbi:pseudouridine synthase [Undibacterium fentianense]|nr:pseudouridine synthase [Undibacterium fentianense]